MQPQTSGPPPGLNMAPILAALKMRQQGGALGGALGASGAPMAAQQSTMPTTPMQSAGSMPTQVQQGAGPDQQMQNGALKSGQQAQGPQFDQETRDLAKSLVQRLLKGI